MVDIQQRFHPAIHIHRDLIEKLCNIPIDKSHCKYYQQVIIEILNTLESNFIHHKFNQNTIAIREKNYSKFEIVTHHILLQIYISCISTVKSLKSNYESKAQMLLHVLRK